MRSACAVPFGLNARMQNAWMYFGGGMDLMNEFYKKFNIIAFPAGNTGAQMGGWFRKEIKEVADLKGLKMRIGGFAGTVLAKLGVVPQQIAGGDIYAALEKGTIDAAEWVGPYDDEKLGFQKVAPYYYYPGWWEGGAMLHNFINVEKWNALPPAYKSTGRARRPRWRTNGCWRSTTPSIRRRCKRLLARRHAVSPVLASDHGCLPQGVARSLCRSVGEESPTSRRSWDAMLAFRNDEYLWWRVAEYTYDDYLIRNRTRT